jgi:hypothetical protein
MSAPLTCPNGHAMDDGLFECPACGAYRPSASDPRAIIRGGRVVGMREVCAGCGYVPVGSKPHGWMCGACDPARLTEHGAVS